MNRSRSYRVGLGFVAYTAIICFALVDGAQAASVKTTWSTYLRSGPGEAYQVIAELDHGSTVDLRGCNGRWCQIQDGRTTGYIDRDALMLPGPPSGAAPVSGAQGCFVAGQTSYRTPAQTRFCATAPGAKTGGR